MTQKLKQVIYVEPKLEILAVEVEKGFAASLEGGQIPNLEPGGPIE